MKVQIPRARFATACAALASIFLAACGSAPDTSDIAKQFSGGCGAMVFKDFKKVDGAEAQNKLYEVAYTFRAEIKGGKTGALDLLTKWISLDQQMIQLEQDKWTIGVDAYLQQSEPLKKQIDALQGGCENAEVFGWMTTLLSATRDNLRGGQTTVPVPYGVDLVGGGLMKKAESGWVFEQLPPHRIANVVQSDPAPFAIAAPPAPKPQAVSTADQTLTGILKSGSFDSCFETTSASGTKCYGFPADGPVAKALITACGQGDRCVVIGRFNDAKEEIESIKSANKAG